MASPKNQVLASFNERKAADFFGKAPIHILGLQVILPALLLSLLFGIYVFADQIMLQQLVPIDGHNYFAPITTKFSSTISNFSQSFFTNKDLINAKILFFGSNELNQQKLNQVFIYSAVQTIGIVNLIIYSLGLFISTGSSVFYSRYLANKQMNREELIRTSFYGTFISSVVLTAIMLGVQGPIINTILPNGIQTGIDSTNNLLNPNNSKTLTDDQNTLIIQLQNQMGANAKPYIQSLLITMNLSRNEIVFNLSQNYLWFLSSSIVLVSILNLYVFFLRAEGKNLWITLFGISANIINIILDYVFIGVAKIGMAGGGLSTLIGYLINLSALFVYIYFLSTKNETNLGFKQLLKFNITPRIIFISFVLGLGTFLRDLSLAVANIIYAPVRNATVSMIGFANILTDAGAISPVPIYNLVFFAIYGIIDGMRPVLAYNYATKNYQRLKQAFYTGILVSFLYALLVNIIIYIPTYIQTHDNQFLFFLGAENNSNRLTILKVWFPALMLQLPFIALAIGGLAIFQATGKMWLNILLSLMQGLITFFPVLYIMAAISVATSSWEVMFYSGFINIVISSLIIFAIAEIYMAKYMGRKEKYTDPQMATESAINTINVFTKKINALFIKNKAIKETSKI
ncbi:MATE family efflux transporter [[Mycoplasma] testudinis]|uniref:hypothetical protein n=1 Tax=[Mycoplasma] testudinis TaxID=33924 RepID=UPI000488B638|nr:hypothetical protein [[Mycoplasma] testudinis]